MAILFEDKTRWQHFWWGVKLGSTLTIFCVIGAMFTAEYKDKAHGSKWDWKDIICGLLGGIVGQVVQVLAVWLVWRLCF